MIFSSINTKIYEILKNLYTKKKKCVKIKYISCERGLFYEDRVAWARRTFDGFG